MQPATSWIASSSSPAKKRMLADDPVHALDHVASLGARFRANGAHLLGDVDADRAPGDAAAAADAAGRVELVPPGRELVGHPLAIARLRRGADAAAVDVGEIHGEAGVPAPRALGARAGEVARVLDRRAEAGRDRPSCNCRRSGSARRPPPSADARDCARSRSWMSSVFIVAAHIGGGPADDRLGGGDVLAGPAASVGISARTARAALRSRLGDELLARSAISVSARSKPDSRLRAGVHRDAEAGAAGLAAIDRDDEGALAPRLVVRIDIGAAEKAPGPGSRSREARRSARR